MEQDILQPGSPALQTENIFVQFCIQNMVTTNKLMVWYAVLMNQMAAGMSLQVSWQILCRVWTHCFFFSCWMWMLNKTRQRNVLATTGSSRDAFPVSGFSPIPFQFLKARSHTGAIAADYEQTQVDKTVCKTLTCSPCGCPGQGKWDALFLESCHGQAGTVHHCVIHKGINPVCTSNGCIPCLQSSYKR